MDAAARPLQGRLVVVTRARPGRVDARLGELGAHVLHAPAISFVDPDDGGLALQRASRAVQRGDYEWLVVTSATAVERLVALDLDLAGIGSVRVAAIGPATARAVSEAGGTVELVAPEAVGESLIEAFPWGDGRVLQLRPEVAREVVADGLRSKGWRVDEVAAYRTEGAEFDVATRDAIRQADAVTFTSPSTVHHLVAALGSDMLPRVAVSIGPVTSAAMRDHGVVVSGEANPHTGDGLVDAVVEALGRPR